VAASGDIRAHWPSRALRCRPRAAVGESARRSANKPRAARTVLCAPLECIDQRSDLKALRISSEKSSGSSQAAKWPPLSGSLK